MQAYEILCWINEMEHWTSESSFVSSWSWRSTSHRTCWITPAIVELCADILLTVLLAAVRVIDLNHSEIVRDCIRYIESRLSRLLWVQRRRRSHQYTAAHQGRFSQTRMSWQSTTSPISTGEHSRLKKRSNIAVWYTIVETTIVW